MYTKSESIKELYKAMNVAHKILLDNNIIYYATGGTLLGAVRHKGIIPWDDDLDLEVGYKDFEKLLSRKVRDQFRKYGYKIKKQHSGEDPKEEYSWVKLRKIDKKSTGINIDFFPTKIIVEKERFRTMFSSDIVAEWWPKHYFYMDELLPLREVNFGDGKILIPNKPEPYLKRGYGNDWDKVGYITMDKEHFSLDKPIKVEVSKFVSAKPHVEPTKNQIVKISKNDPRLLLISAF
jgi:lipopolysaccharide cholinephosphotransferase